MKCIDYICHVNKSNIRMKNFATDTLNTIQFTLYALWQLFIIALTAAVAIGIVWGIFIGLVYLYDPSLIYNPFK